MPKQVTVPTEWPRRFVHWLCDGRADFREFQRRKSTQRHRAGRTRCWWVWLAAAALIAICPSVSCIVTLLLAATFLSFSILDDS